MIIFLAGPPTTFNRGMLLNVGYLEALRVSEEFDCFVFHDVDMIPRNDHCYYRCHPSRTVHLTNHVNAWNYSEPYPGYFGGCVAISSHQFKTMNGASNLYFGWGGEDEDLKQRANAKGFKPVRFPSSVCSYDTPVHVRDEGNEGNADRGGLMKTMRRRQEVEGLNTTLYTLVKRKFRPLYVWLNVFINMTEVLEKTTPDYVRSDISDLLRRS